MPMGQTPEQVLREALESPAMEVYKTQQDKETSEQPGLALTLL